MCFRRLFLSLATLSVLAMPSCYNDIDLDKYKGESGVNLLSLNTVVNPDSSVAVLATRTFFFTDSHKEIVTVDGLDMTMTVNDHEEVAMTYDKKKRFYVTDFKPKEGDRLLLTTVFNGKPVSAQTDVPRRVAIEQVKAERQGPMHIFWDNDYQFTYKITFRDAPGEANYYFLWPCSSGIGMENVGYPLGQGQFDYTYDFVFQQLAKTVNATVPGWEPYGALGLPFSDEGIDGKTYTLTLKEVVQNSPGNDPRRYDSMPRCFRLYAISKDYYDYLVSIFCSDTSQGGIHAGMIDIGIVEPVGIHSNITGGVGIFGAYAMTSFSLDVFEQTGRFTERGW